MQTLLHNPFNLQTFLTKPTFAGDKQPSFLVHTFDNHPLSIQPSIPADTLGQPSTTTGYCRSRTRFEHPCSRPLLLQKHLPDSPFLAGTVNKTVPLKTCRTWMGFPIEEWNHLSSMRKAEITPVYL